MYGPRTIFSAFFTTQNPRTPFNFPNGFHDPGDSPLYLHDTSLDYRAVKSRIIALMRRLERGAGRISGAGDAASSSGSRRPAIPGLGLVRRPRARFAPSHPGGVGAPPGGTMASCQELADGSASTAPLKARPAAVRTTPQQSAERRAGLRYWPVIFGRSRRSAQPRGGHRVRRFRTSACRRSAPPRRERQIARGAPRAPRQAGGGALAKAPGVSINWIG